MSARRFTFVRHASTVYNELGLLNGDPAVPVPLGAAGRVSAAALAPHFANVPLDLALHTRFARTRETLRLLLGHRRDVPVAVETAFDDVDVGEFEGQVLQTYRSWRASRGPEQAMPGGESRLGALARYADGCARVLARRDARFVLLVVHDVPIRFVHNALLRADPLDGPIRTVANLERLSLSEGNWSCARGHAPQALRASADLIPRDFSDRSARSGRPARGARCRSERRLPPGGGDRSRCKASVACYEYAANYNNLSIRKCANPSIGGRAPLRSRGAHGGHHWRIERHRARRRA